MNIRLVIPFVQGEYRDANKGVTVADTATREVIFDTVAADSGNPDFAEIGKEHCYLRYNGREIAGDTTLRDVGAGEGSSLTCLLRMRGGGGRGTQNDAELALRAELAPVASADFLEKKYGKPAL